MKAESGGLFVDAGADMDGPYRYHLWREWGTGPGVLWIMLNPSTADADQLDPTLRRVLRYTEEMGFNRFDVCNLYAWRATDPDDMIAQGEAGVDIIGPRNNAAILEHARKASTALVVCGWGTKHTDTRGPAVAKMLLDAKIRLEALHITQGGHPGHPLYLPAELRPTLWKS